MADLNYTNATYDSSLYKNPTESFSDYMQRLAAQRAAGILGGGGMLNTAEGTVNPVTGDTTLTQAVVDPVSNEITSVPLGMLTKGGELGSAPSGWDSAKTLEQMTADAIARQTELYGPRAVDAVGFFAGAPVGAAASVFENAVDKSTIGSYLDKVGYTSTYGEKARDALAANPTAVMSLMASGDLPAVGGFQNLNMSQYQPQTWLDLGGKVVTGLADRASGLLNSLVDFVTPDAYEATTFAAPQYMNFNNFAPDPDMGIARMEDIYNETTVGNKIAGLGNFDPNTGGYTIGTSANRNADGSYTIGTSLNRDPVTGAYTIGTKTGSSPIATNEAAKAEAAFDKEFEAAIAQEAANKGESGGGGGGGGWSSGGGSGYGGDAGYGNENW